MFTFTADTAGTYQINVQLHFDAGSSSSLGESDNKFYKIQLLPMFLASGDSFVGDALLAGYSRNVNTSHWKGQSLQTTTTLTFASGDKFWIECKIATDDSSGNFRLAGAANTGFSNLWLEMIKIA